MTDIVNKLDELLAFAAGIAAVKASKIPTVATDKKWSLLVSKITWARNELKLGRDEWNVAIDKVSNDENIPKATVKKLKKFFKKHG